MYGICIILKQHEFSYKNPMNLGHKEKFHVVQSFYIPHAIYCIFDIIHLANMVHFIH